MARMGLTLLRACALMGLGCALAVGGTALAQPANDVCSQAMTGFAIPPAGGTVTGTLVGASRDATSTYCPGNQTGPDVYHTITPTLAGIYTFETCGLATWDTVLSLHTGCPVSAANQVGQACSDDACGTQSRMSAQLTPGQMYVVRVGAYSNTTAVGPYSLAVTYTPPLTNDECGSTNPNLALDVPTTGSTVGATTTLAVTPNTLCGSYGGSGGGADVFFRFAAPSSGTYTFSTCGSNFDTVMSVHAGCPAGVENLLGCNDDGPAGFCPGSGLVSFLTLPLTAQQVYYVRVGGYAAQVPATGMVSVTVHRNQNSIATGACCGVVTGTTTCEMRPADQCASGYLGDDTSCSPDPCTASGACCRSDGSCLRVLSGMCAGTYQGDSSACGNSLCPQPPVGVCCIGAICMMSLPADCSSPGPLVGAVWVYGTSECNVSAAANVPCCRADFNKVDGITVQDIFDFLNSWFAGSPFTHLATPGTATIQDIFDYLNSWFAGGC